MNMCKQLRIKLIEIIRKEFNNPSLMIHDQIVIKDIEGWNSLRQVALIVAIEKEFNISFKASEMRTIGQYCHLESLLNEKLPPLEK